MRLPSIPVLSGIFLVLAVAAPAGAAWHPTGWMDTWEFDVDGDRIDDRIDPMSPPFQIVVDLDHTVTPDEENYLAGFGTVDFRSKYVNAIWMDEVGSIIGSPALDSILTLPGVLMIEGQTILEPHLSVSTRAIQVRGSTEYGSENLYTNGLRGHGLNIAILDTGVDNWHESLDDVFGSPGVSKFVAGMNATVPGRPGGETTDPDDDWGDNGGTYHGTHVAGIALGTGGGAGVYMGVAPEAKLLDVKVCDANRIPSPGCEEADISAGVEWCIDNRDSLWVGQGSDYRGIDVLNISLGRNEDVNGQGALSQLLNRAVSLGLVVVVSAGNDGPNSGFGRIAAADRVITVANSDDQGTIARDDDDLWNSSTRGPRLSDGDTDDYDELKPDLAAPGRSIRSAEGALVPPTTHTYVNKTGTSMAAPHVAGAAALMLQARPGYRRVPDLLKEALRCSSHDQPGQDAPALDNQYDHDFGWGITNAYNAVFPDTLDLWIKPWGADLNPPEEPKWQSDDIWVDTTPVEAGQPNGISARVHNDSAWDAENVRVHFSVNNYGASSTRPWIDLGDVQMPSVPAGGTLVAHIDWTPADTRHQCIKVTVQVCSPDRRDTNISNNRAIENVGVQTTSSPTPATPGGGLAVAEYPIEVYNPYADPRLITSTISGSSIPPSWSAQLALQTIVVDGGDVAMDTLRIFHPEGGGGEGWVDVDVQVAGDPDSLTAGVTAYLSNDGIVPGAPESLPTGAVTALHGGFPNPYRTATGIRFGLAAPGFVDVQVYDAAGRTVRSLLVREFRPAGAQEVAWDGRDHEGRIVSPGVYFVRLRVDDFTATRKVVRMR